jgi:ribose transport system permease protein
VLAAGVVAILWLLLSQTRYGLRTYALGASAEATARAGINVRRHTLSLYALMGLLCGVVGVMDVSRFATASIAAHTQDNLAAIAAVVIGGTSLFGGKGRMGGTIIGAFIPAVLRNGFILMGVQPFWQNVAVGAVLVLAVYVDQERRRRARLV